MTGFRKKENITSRLIALIFLRVDMLQLYLQVDLFNHDLIYMYLV